VQVRIAVTIEPLDADQAMVALAAWRRFGKGRHPAGLNLGDCFSYALARTLDSNPPNVYGYGHEGYYRNVLAVLRGDAKPDTDGRAGRKSLELILGIYESAKTGCDVPLPLRG